jgi:hypothetical protein
MDLRTRRGEANGRIAFHKTSQVCTHIKTNYQSNGI